jgi:hypothetical protein
MPRHNRPTITVSELRAEIVRILGATKLKRMAESGLRAKVRQNTGKIVPTGIWREALRTEPRVKTEGSRVFLKN